MQKKTSVLIIDDCPEYTGLLRYVLEQIPTVEILDTAEDGMEGLYHILRFKPDVVLLDLEMPRMDGMTALYHIMIHRPTPTIVFSSLSDVASSRAFDVLKNGAVDFIYKNQLTDESESTPIEDVLAEKINAAAQMKVAMRKAFSLSQITDIAPKPPQERVIFCEDCGNRMVVSILEEKFGVSCDRCGDILISPSEVSQKPSSLAIFLGGEGASCNILDIIPDIENCSTTTLIGILDVEEQYLDSFVDYVDAISALSVVRGAAGSVLEKGHCYLFTRSANLCLKPSSLSFELQHIPDQVAEIDPTDLMLASVAKLFKQQSLVVILSGKESIPIRGIEHMKKNGVSIFSADPKLCQYPQAISSVADKLSDQLSSKEILCEIAQLGDDVEGYA